MLLLELAQPTCAAPHPLPRLAPRPPQAFGEAQMTVAEATDIADNALEHTVRAVMQAVQVRLKRLG